MAQDYGVAKSTIIGIPRENSVTVRRQPLTPQQIDEAMNLYDSGLSLSQTSLRLNVNQETMRVALIVAGTTIRTPTGGRAN